MTHASRIICACAARDARNAPLDDTAGRRGFTLIEVLMAAFVLAIGVLGLTALFAGAARQQQLSSQTTRSVAVARSAEAFIADRFGLIENMDGDPELKLGSALPQNNQAPVTSIQNDQWYAIPRAADGSFSLNPREATTGWNNDSLYTRSKPREALPRLLYRNRVELQPDTFVRTGQTGSNNAGTGLGAPLDQASEDFGAPPFDGALRELRVIADSVTLRVVVREFPCASANASTNERSVLTPVDTEVRLRFEEELATDEFELSDGETDGSTAILVSNPQAKDSDFVSASGDTRISFMRIKEVLQGLLNEPDCRAVARRHWVPVVNPSDPSDCDGDQANWQYLWSVSANGTHALDTTLSTSAGAPGYDIRRGMDDGERYYYAQLRHVDRCNTSGPVYVEQAGGDFVLQPSGDPGDAPPDWTGTPPVLVRAAQFPSKFIAEIWLESYEYRGHTLASLPETISYAAAEGAEGSRVPQLGYSMLFRRTSSSAVQYALLSYAIAPTAASAADRIDTTDDDFFPREDAGAFSINVAPIRLVRDLRIEFDENLGQYYIPLVGQQASALAFVTTPGQVLLFNGRSSDSVPGADGPVRVVSARRVGGNEVRAYLDGPPRAGLRALTDFDAGNTFDAWTVQNKCQVSQVKRPVSSPTYFWSLRPLEARIFTVSK